MKNIELEQSFVHFLVNVFDTLKRKENNTLIRFCSALLSARERLENKTVADVLRGNLADLQKISRGIGPRGYEEFCKLFLNCQIKIKGWAFFKEYIAIQKKNRQITKRVFRHPVVKIKTVTINTNPKTKVYEISIHLNGDKTRVIRKTLNTPVEIKSLFTGLQVWAFLVEEPPFKLPKIPK